jgi:carbamoyl-phosphate synthase large subunit
MYEALRKGASVQALYDKTRIKHWFIQQMAELVALEEEILKYKGKKLPDKLLIQAKKDGFADRYLAKILGVPEDEIRKRRIGLGIIEAWDAVPVSGVENAAYYYSTYNAPDTVGASKRRKVLVLGGGPNRIGQGIEFDYCCVHAAFTLRDEGYESIMINCNPETVSTDYDTSDKLYFEPLTVEDVLSIYEKEKPEGVIVQFAGRRLNLADGWPAASRSSGPRPAMTCEDRDRSASHRKWDSAAGSGYGLGAGEQIVAAVLPPLGGASLWRSGPERRSHRQVPRKRHRNQASDCRRTAALMPAVMGIELAGIHSGDSAASPAGDPAEKHIDTISDYTRRIAVA